MLTAAPLEERGQREAAAVAVAMVVVTAAAAAAATLPLRLSSRTTADEQTLVHHAFSFL